MSDEKETAKISELDEISSEASLNTDSEMPIVNGTGHNQTQSHVPIINVFHAMDNNYELQQTVNDIVQDNLPVATTETAGLVRVGEGLSMANDGTLNYDVDGHEAVLISKDITANGTYLALNDNADGYFRAVVNVEGSQTVLGPKSITTNGTYDPSDDSLDGYSGVTVAVPGPTLSTKSINQNGTYTASSESLDGYSEVTVSVPASTLGTKAITTNGTYQASSDSLDGYSQVSVNVSTSANLGTKTVYQNGTYVASSDNLDGYSQVSVSLPLGTKSITTNGTYAASADSLEGFTSVTVNVSGGGGQTLALHEGKISKNDGSISVNSSYWYSDEFDAATGAVMFDFGEIDADNNIIAWYVNSSFVDCWSSSQRYRLVDASGYYQNGMKYRLCFKKSVLEDVLYKDYVADKTISFDDSVIVVPSIELHEGAIDTDGTIVADSDYYYTDFIDMSQNQAWIMFDVGTGSGGSYEGLRIYYSDGTLQDYWSANERFRMLDFSNVWQSGMKMRLSFKKQYAERAVIIDYTGNIAYYCGDVKKLEE